MVFYLFRFRSIQALVDFSQYNVATGSWADNEKKRNQKYNNTGQNTSINLKV